MDYVRVKSRASNGTLINSMERASKLIPVLAYSPEDELFLMDDQTLGFCFVGEPLSYGDEKIQERVGSMLNQSFPANTSLQIALFRSPDINRQLNEILNLRNGYRHKLLSNVVKERVSFLRKYSQQALVTNSKKGMFDNGHIQDLKLIISCKIPMKGRKPTEEEMLQVKHLKTKIESALKTIGMHPQTVTAVMYRRIMGTLINWGATASWHLGNQWEDDRPICNQIFDYDSTVTVGHNELKLGEQHVAVLSAKNLPPSTFFGNALNYIGDITGGTSSVKENYLVVTNLIYPDSLKMKDHLEKKRKFTINQAYGPLLKFVPVLAEKEESFRVLFKSLGKGSMPLKLSYSVAIFAPTQKRVQAAATSLAAYWREQRFSIMQDVNVVLPIFLNCLPLCTDARAIKDLHRYKTMTSHEATVLIPIFGEWKGTGTFHTTLLSRNGQIMPVSLHDSDTNKNLCIAAESGSGKSFWANELLLSYMSEGAQVWVIDAGKSYQNLCSILDGDFLQFTEEADISMSPFGLVQSYQEDEDSLVALVSAMASPGGKLLELQIAGLKKIMSELWATHGQSLLIDHIAQACLASEDQRMKDVGSQLFGFTSQGSYGRYFSKANNVSFNNQFTVLELDELQGRKHLRQVVLLQLIFQIQQEVFLGERDRKKVVFIDEAWDLLKEGEISTFIEHAYRKFRKYNGSVIIATQSINDLYENKVGRAIAENSSSMHLLGQTEETVESIRRSGRLSLSEGGYNLLRSVHTISGVYSEIFIKSKAGMGVGRLIVSDFQKLLYSTDPVDVQAITTYKRQGMSVPDAINSVLRDRGLIDSDDRLAS